MTFLWLVYQQLKVSIVLFSQIALKVKGWQSGQGLAYGLSRPDILPSRLGFPLGFALRFGLGLWMFGLGLRLARWWLWHRWAGQELLIRRNDVRQKKYFM